MTHNEVKHNLRITILGCGSSGGVPRVGGDWGACDPQQPKNTRTRSSILVEYWQGEGATMPCEELRTIVLIDTAPDLRAQLLSANVQHIDAVLYTHDHGDQTHGIDDLRAMAYRQVARIPTYMGAETKINLLQRFLYCFEKPKGRVHPPILELKDDLIPGESLFIDGPGGGLPITIFEVGHGNMNALGFKFCNKVAYSPDMHSIDTDNLTSLNGVDTWIVDALRYHNHPTHAHMDKTLHYGAQVQAKQLIFTNMHIDMDYDTIANELLGPHIPAYDGMEIVL